MIEQALVFSLLAMSMQVALRSGVFSLACIGCWGVGAYTSAILALKDVPAVLGVGAGVILAVLLGVALGLVLRRLRDLYMAMATIAFVLLVQTLVQTLELTGGAIGLYGIPASLGLGTLVAIVSISAIALLALERGATGRALEVLRLDELLAGAVGLNIARWRLGIFVLSCALGALSGGLYPLLFTAISPPDVGFGLVVNVLTMIVIGGTAAWWGAPVGAVLVTWVIPEILSFSGPSLAILQGSIVVFMVVFVPGGVVGLTERLRRAVLDRSYQSKRPTTTATEVLP